MLYYVHDTISHIVLIHRSAPSGPPINITAVNVTTSSVSIEWRPPNPLEANGAIVMYSLNFTRTDIGDSVVKQFSKDQLSYKQQGMYFDLYSSTELFNTTNVIV